VAVFVSFSDESGPGNSTDGTFLVSGYVAEESEWPYIAHAWQQWVLDGPKKIPYLHMIEIDDEWQLKYGDMESTLDEAARLLSHSGSLRIVRSRVDLAELSEAVSAYDGKAPRTLRDPDYYCYLKYFVAVTIGVHRTFPLAERIDFVVSRKQYVTHHLEKSHDDLKSWFYKHVPQVEGLIGDIIPGDMKDRLPLQAADFLCWHLQREEAGKITQKQRQRLASAQGISRPITLDWSSEELRSVVDLMNAKLNGTETAIS
jgi:hypothetical protein